MGFAIKIAVILLAAASYVLLHEFGHYAVAYALNLGPSFVIGSQSSTSGILGMSIGVKHLGGIVGQDMLVIIGATILPTIFLLFIAAGPWIERHEEVALFSVIFAILIFVNLLPFPGAENMDANKLWTGLSILK
ncbi:MAG: hypothetical protein HY362_00515 [Candidatus Aenigmarchaeota archaeon]|nr:hypothetical protein [Candidatus Aenigmarchaeota archaeon]